MHQEDEIKKKLYRTLLALLLVITTMYVVVRFFSGGLGSFFGLISKVSRPSTKGDTSAPAPPYFYSPPSTTKEKNISLRGFSEPNSQVHIYVNGPETTSVTADGTGNFIVDSIELIEGRNLVSAKAEDADKNQSQASQMLEIVYDTKKPKITVTEPKDGSTVRNLNQRITIKGSTDEKSQVTINEKLAVTRPDNTFELLLGVAEGTVEITVEATDEAGNKSSEKFKVTYVKAGL